jgi:hypothetical protein
MTDPGLFPDLAGAGQAEQAMAAQITAWQAAGRAVSLVTRRMLLDQAHAVDLARLSRRATQISGASRVLLELLVGFHLLDDSPPPVDDPFAKFLADVAGDDAAAGVTAGDG